MARSQAVFSVRRAVGHRRRKLSASLQCVPLHLLGDTHTPTPHTHKHTLEAAQKSPGLGHSALDPDSDSTFQSVLVRCLLWPQPSFSLGEVCSEPHHELGPLDPTVPSSHCLCWAFTLPYGKSPLFALTVGKVLRVSLGPRPESRCGEALGFIQEDGCGRGI